MQPALAGEPAMTLTTGPHPDAAGSPPASIPAPRGSSSACAPGGRPPGSGTVIRIRLLGRFAVERDGQEIPRRAYGGQLPAGCCGCLRYGGARSSPKDLIAEALWPGDPPADAPGNIEVLVSRIRRALGDRTLIQTGPGGYILTDDGRCWVDAEAFLAAVHAGRAGLAGQPGRSPRVVPRRP